MGMRIAACLQLACLSCRLVLPWLQLVLVVCSVGVRVL